MNVEGLYIFEMIRMTSVSTVPQMKTAPPDLKIKVCGFKIKYSSLTPYLWMTLIALILTYDYYLPNGGKRSTSCNAGINFQHMNFHITHQLHLHAIFTSFLECIWARFKTCTPVLSHVFLDNHSSPSWGIQYMA